MGSHNGSPSGCNNEESERFGTARAWSIELGIGDITVRKRLEGIEGISGRDCLGRVHVNMYHPESVVRQACANLLRDDVEMADDNGFIYPNGIKCGTVGAWYSSFPVSRSYFAKRLRGREFVTGKDDQRRIQKFYPESVVREACPECFEPNLPQANDEGYIKLGDQICKTAPAWSKELGVSVPTIKKRIDSESVVQGKDSRGQIQDYYPENIVLDRCKDISRQDIPCADENGFFDKDGERYGTILAWARVLPISDPPVRKRLKGVKGIVGKASSGNLCHFFPKSVVLDLCADLLQADLPESDGEGILLVDGRRYATRTAWAKILSINDRSIWNKLGDVDSVTGKNSSGLVCQFISEKDVRKKLADLLDDTLLKADTDGFFGLDGQRYGTIFSWSRVLPIGYQLLSKKLNGEDGIRGKDCLGRISLFFSEKIVREKCANFVDTEVPQADSNGSFSQNGETFMTKGGWRKALSVSWLLLEKAFEGESGVEGRDSVGHLRQFFPESLIRSKFPEVFSDKHG